MAIKMNLDTIREAIQKKYDSFDVEFGEDTLSLRNPIRLPEKDRDTLLGLQSKFSKGEGDEEQTEAGLKEVIRELVLVTASDKAVAKRFLKAIAPSEKDGEVDDELLILTDVFSGYMDEQQVGEA